MQGERKGESISGLPQPSPEDTKSDLAPLSGTNVVIIIVRSTRLHVHPKDFYDVSEDNLKDMLQEMNSNCSLSRIDFTFEFMPIPFFFFLIKILCKIGKNS